MRESGWMFPAATLGPALLLLLAAMFGGAFALAALLSITVVTFALDLIVARAGAARTSEFPAADGLSTVIAASHFVLLAAGVAALSGGWLNPHEKAKLLLALGLWLGLVSNANAHELIHRTNRRLSGLGRWVYISLLFGHHASAHPKVHHPNVGTADDPNTAKLGESLYAFLPRAWAQSFKAGWKIELSHLRRKHGQTVSLRHHPYMVYVGGSLAFLATAAATGGAAAGAAYLLLALMSQMQLLVSDYIQHYGLERRKGPDGRLEPVGPRHSWNAAHPWSGHMMLNAPRHSDHHAHPARPYPELTLPPASVAPRLPASLPVMGLIAFIPPLWRRVMDRRARAWMQGELPHGTAA